MAKSIRQLQDEIINDGFIDSLASDQTNYQDLKQYPVLKKMILLASENFIATALEELERQGKVNTGGLSDGLSSTDVLENTDGYSVELGYDSSDPSAKYYDYVNKGVAGVGKNRTKYFFKELTVSPKMVSAIQLWMEQRGFRGSNEDQRDKLTADQTKNKSLAQTPKKRLRSFAYFTAKKIKREGIPYSGFFDKAVEAQFGKDFAAAVASAVTADLRVYIRKLDLLINKEKSSEN